jgi:hypothetical protein
MSKYQNSERPSLSKIAGMYLPRTINFGRFGENGPACRAEVPRANGRSAVIKAEMTKVDKWIILGNLFLLYKFYNGSTIHEGRSKILFPCDSHLFVAQCQLFE